MAKIGDVHDNAAASAWNRLQLAVELRRQPDASSSRLAAQPASRASSGQRSGHEGSHVVAWDLGLIAVWGQSPISWTVDSVLTTIRLVDQTKRASGSVPRVTATPDQRRWRGAKQSWRWWCQRLGDDARASFSLKSERMRVEPEAGALSWSESTTLVGTRLPIGLCNNEHPRPLREGKPEGADCLSRPIWRRTR